MNKSLTIKLAEQVIDSKLIYFLNYLDILLLHKSLKGVETDTTLSDMDKTIVQSLIPVLDKHLILTAVN